MNPYTPVIPVIVQSSQVTEAYTGKNIGYSVVQAASISTMKGSQSLKQRTTNRKITIYFNII